MQEAAGSSPVSPTINCFDGMVLRLGSVICFVCAHVAALILPSILPSTVLAWRGYQSYIGASFGAQFSESYQVNSSDPAKDNTYVSFSLGADLTGSFGYALGNYIVVEGFLDFFSAKNSGTNYFITGDPPSSSSSASIIQTQPTTAPERFTTVTFGLNAYIFLDGGGDFVPYFGAGAGLLGANWGGFDSSTFSSELFFGGDLLLYPMMSTYIQLRFIKNGNLDFQTTHTVYTTDAKGNSVMRQIPYRDSLPSTSFVRADWGVRMAF